MRNSSIFSAGRSLLAVVVLLLVVASAADGAKRREHSVEDLTNFLLGPRHSQWLVGAIAKIASEKEIDQYLALSSDAEAEAFIEEFWRRRQDPERPWPQEQPQGVYERRAEEADRLFTEATFLGRRTDRGETHILYGPPDRIEYFQEPPPRRIRVEVWVYAGGDAESLDGEEPRSRYFFAKKGNVTVRHTPSPRSRRLIQQGRR